MKGSFVSKMLSILIVLTMLATAFVITTMVVVPTVNAYPPTSTPFVNDWGNATTELVYSTTATTVTINTTGLKANTPYYIYKPNYNETSGTPSDFSWDSTPVAVGSNLVTFTTGANPTWGTATFVPDFPLDRAGMWVIDDNPSHDGSTGPNFLSSVPSFIWVNSSRNYTITMSDTTFKLGSVSKETITVDTGSDSYIYIDLLNKDANTLISGFHLQSATGSLTFDVDGTWHNITTAGNYSVRAYKDLDGAFAYGYGTWGWNSTHNFSGVTGYNYSTVGPWDPPEKNATDFNFAVTTGTPIITPTNTSNVYWGYPLKIELNVTDSNKMGITGGNITLVNFSGNKILWNMSPADLWINETGNGNYTIELSRYVIAGSVWETLVNNSWYIVFSNNTVAGTWEEWNSTNTAYFYVSSSSPPVRIILTSDGDSATGSFIDYKVNVPAYTTGTNTVGTIKIDFTIYGTSVAGDRAYYGDQAWEDKNNITVAGDILYPNAVDLTYSGAGTWRANVTPTKPGGSILMSINWPGSDNGSAALDPIYIINGTVVTPSAESFIVGQNFNLTTHVIGKDIYNPDGYDERAAVVNLTWRGTTTLINSTTGTGAPRNGYLGDYNFLITPAEQLTTAPQNITIAAKAATGFWGYASVEMVKNSNLWVNCSPTTAYAGDGQRYTMNILADGTTTPATYSDINVALYDMKGNKVAYWGGITGQYQITDTIPLPAGTYQLFAYNNTHTSEGHNATITVTPYHIDCSPTVLAWLIDTDTNMTFQVTPTQNGSLTINNMSNTPNCSFVGQTRIISIRDGIGTLNDVDATDLGNLTFAFMPDGGNSQETDATSILHITTATASPDPKTIYITEPTNVVITVTHPATGAPLEGVRVGLDHGMNLSDSVLSKLPTDQITDTSGKVTFAITSMSSGDITIYLNNGTDSNAPYVIASAYRTTMVITVSAPSVYEGDTFTVYAKDSSEQLITAEVSVLFNGTTTKTTTGSLDLTAPLVGTTLDYTIVASAPGYTTDHTSIKVINKPMIFMSAPTSANAKESFTVTAGGDDGNSYGILITIKDSSGTTVASGTTAGPSGLSFSLDKGTYNITATKDGYTAATPVTITITEKPTPGFELLTLIIAIGVAFILLRRRRK